MKTGGCSKCGGDTYYEIEIYGIEEKCLQCGFAVKSVEVKRYRTAPAEPTPEQKKTARRAATDARNKEILRLADEEKMTYGAIGFRYRLAKSTIRLICQMERLKEEKICPTN